MTTKKNMVKLALMSALTAGIFGFTACSDDLNELNNVEALNSLDSNKLLNLSSVCSTTGPICAIRAR